MPVPIVIIAMESMSDALRPLRSLYEPSTSAPNGRARYESAKVPSVSSSDIVAFWTGKKSFESVDAK